MNIDVTTVARKEQKLSDSAAAVYVITKDDIQRSGATNVPDLLRMVPGLNVAQINGSKWAVSSRGLNAEFSNELMVLVDGRTVYSPTTGGVFWDVLDFPLEDIDRIEVIRGPGGSLWGENAVNGVVNIITTTADQTPGGEVIAGGGNAHEGISTVQYGGALGGNTDFRFYSKYFNENDMPSLDGQDGADGWHVLRGGFRTDSSISDHDSISVQGDMYSGLEGDPTTYLPSLFSPGRINANTEVTLSGGYIQSVWDHSNSDGSATTVQISFDQYRRYDVLREQRSTASIQFQHHFALSDRHDIVWGLEYDFSSSQTNGDLTFSLNPPNLNTNLYSLFIQDEITFVPHRLNLTVGAKVEHNDYTGFLWMPTARVAWLPDSQHMFWSAVSNTARTPASVDVAELLNLGSSPGPGGIPILTRVVGNHHFKNEGLTAYEAGFRTTLVAQSTFDFAAYYNDYYNQETTEPLPVFFEPAPAPAHFVQPLTYENLMHGAAYGFEALTNWKPAERWQLRSGYAFERIHMHTSAASQDTETAPSVEGASPQNSLQFRSDLVLRKGLTWNASAYFVGKLNDPSVPSYTRVDTGLVWKLNPHATLSAFGQNLLRDHHLEFLQTEGDVISTLVKRNAYLQFVWRF